MLAADTITLIEEMAIAVIAHGEPGVFRENYSRWESRSAGEQSGSICDVHTGGLPSIKCGETWTCDLVQTHDWLFRPVFVFLIIELGSRQVVPYGVTQSPCR